MIGSDYQLTTVFNDNESEVVYNMTHYEKYMKIGLKGQNKMITAIDQIHFRDLGQVTEILYKADISLNGFYFLFTPFIRSGLDKLTIEAKAGMKKRCE